MIHSGRTTPRLMAHAVAALAPIALASTWRFGTAASVLFGVAIATAMLCDAVCDRRNANDGSAVVIGMIVACLMPATAPWWLAAAGSAIAVLLGKHALGGLGRNLFNPAALARVLLMGLAPAAFFSPLWTIDGRTAATPLAKELGASPVTVVDLLLGLDSVTLGDAMPVAVLVGGLVLIALRTIDWQVPLCYLGAISLLALVLPPGERIVGHAPWLAGNPMAHLLNGSTLFCAFFMLTDPVTAPFTRPGRLVFCTLAAAYTMVVRYYTPYPDGVAFAVLLANASVPFIDRKMIWGSVGRGASDELPAVDRQYLAGDEGGQG
ncbi:MAG: RnfABCDGE type electron transport complex subunit D [Vicinamibacterales bacterium]|nr:RnfABCDGE type electron transport complex subunit D [Vicinamibacterales bacterium]